MHQIRIGKHIIETLTSGMYEDSLYVFREYIQNSADQIDKAVEMGILSDKRQGQINVNINKRKREIIISDNATGIASDMVISTLGDIADSQKDRTVNKGFRGIGRLGGLGYCKELIFETSYKGESLKSIMTWDAQDLISKLNDHNLKIDALTVVSSVIDLDIKPEDDDSHYFNVILKGVNAPELLDIEKVESYLSMVAPVPFQSRFIFKDRINEELINRGVNLDEYSVYLNTDQIFKAYRTSFYEKDPPTKYDEVFEIEFIDFKDSKDELIAVGWYGISTFDKQIPNIKYNLSRGIRLRKANIQIGSDTALVKLFKEARGNFYFIGEIHAIHSDLIPNSRRDYFNENLKCLEFDESLRKFFHNKLHKLYHEANKIKNAQKKIENVTKLHDTYNQKAADGFSSNEEQEKLISCIEKSEIEAKKKQQELSRIEQKASNDETLNKIYKKIITTKKPKINNNKPKFEATDSTVKFRTDKLSKLSKAERKLVSKVFSVIDNVLTPDLAENLKFKIEEGFK
ncbi:ATP-binding protein [Carboxylicivirga mesophila]|uniref:ATP-binding protein n=1 Tax=Carboxylicivirga mesophila TaxID=1166478 RepID=A0ABS5K7C1_9BACT|nr:ATP-binding protein [Carboxylicivirga mesophila]MBS2210258.1 ATP-binding protein [Carboxylicivirga mesophila]